MANILGSMGRRADVVAEVQLSYVITLVAGEGFEPSKALPGDLQSPPIGHSGNPPGS